MSKLIDVSCWNSGIDYDAVKASGIDSVIIRAGYGREAYQKDSQFENHYAGAKAAGMNIGVYWYSYADSVQDAITEAEACLECIKGKSFNLPIYFDMEENWQTALGRAKLTTMATAFCQTIEEAGYRAGVYSNVNWFTNFLDYNRLAEEYSIWLAQWGTSSYSYACDIWQYTEDGSVRGISGDVDLNEIINPSVIYGGGARKETCTVTFDYLAKSGYTSTGDQVKTVQRLLNAMEYRDANAHRLDVDGIFGDCTDYTVRLFQRDNGLDDDGIVGPATWKALTGAN